jgi:hypothetical protein
MTIHRGYGWPQRCPGLFGAYLEQEPWALGEHNFNREYLGIPIGATASPFGWDLYERATQIRAPLVRPGRAFGAPPETQAVPIANPFQCLQHSGVVR